MPPWQTFRDIVDNAVKNGLVGDTSVRMDMALLEIPVSGWMCNVLDDSVMDIVDDAVRNGLVGDTCVRMDV